MKYTVKWRKCEYTWLSNREESVILKMFISRGSLNIVTGYGPDDRGSIPGKNRKFLFAKSLCNVVIGYQRFSGPCCLHLQGDSV